ncbi:hypothetical protein ACJMK2_015643 [Sinanodonta woodiana]|uniref:Small ribosomal subunit protein mS25 n=1 Tax=Sinanodonta woodiana TaxID=1069815 RepID=A0ABD3UU92_SINWO
MPFMKGNAPVRRTLEYLKKGKLVFKENVKVMTINFNTNQPASKGAYEFLFWHLPQIQFKNPNVQILSFKNMTPSPFIQLFFGDGKRLLVDVDSRSRYDILGHIRKIAGKPDDVLQAEILTQQEKLNPANFGSKCKRWCICEAPGQIPCPSYAPLPKNMRGKYTMKKTPLED